MQPIPKVLITRHHYKIPKNLLLFLLKRVPLIQINDIIAPVFPLKELSAFFRQFLLLADVDEIVDVFLIADLGPDGGVDGVLVDMLGFFFERDELLVPTTHHTSTCHLLCLVLSTNQLIHL